MTNTTNKENIFYCSSCNSVQEHISYHEGLVCCKCKNRLTINIGRVYYGITETDCSMYFADLFFDKRTSKLYVINEEYEGSSCGRDNLEGLSKEQISLKYLKYEKINKLMTENKKLFDIDECEIDIDYIFECCDYFKLDLININLININLININLINFLNNIKK